MLMLGGTSGVAARSRRYYGISRREISMSWIQPTGSTTYITRYFCIVYCRTIIATMAIKRHLPVLLAAVLLNYAAQIPYYLHQYYFPRHILPNFVGTALLTATLVWFLVGYSMFVRDKKYGKGLLLSFLVAQVLFYGHAIIFGLINESGIVAQLKTHSPFLFVIFLIGYINFAVAGYYFVRLLRKNSNATAA